MKQTLLLRILAAACSLISVAPTTAFAQVYPTWAFQPGGLSSSGQNGIVFANVDGVGLDEIIVSGQSLSTTGGPMGLATIQYRDGTYTTSSVTPLGSGIRAETRLLKVDTPGAQDRVALVEQRGFQNVVAVFSGKPLEEFAAVIVPADFYLSQVADVDADGRLEILGFIRSFAGPIPGSGPAILMDFETGVEEWRSLENVSTVAAGQLDADPALEIVMGQNGNLGLILDGATRTQAWNYPDGFSGPTVFGNFWGTTEAKEFIQLSGFNKVFVSEPFFSPVFEFYAAPAIFAVNDLTNDQFDDLILHDGNFGVLQAYSTRTGSSFFQWINPGQTGISAIAAGNADGIDGKELVIGTREVLHLLSAETGETRYLSRRAYGPYSSLVLADVQGDSRQELVFSVGRGSGSREQIVVVDAETGVEIRRRLSLPFAMGDIPPVIDAFDSEPDGKKEIVVGVSQNVALIDGTTLDVRWSVPIDSAGVLRRFTRMQFNADSVDDIVIATSQRVLILDGRNGAELYRSAVILADSIFDIAIGNMDGDAQSEIAISQNQQIYLVDPYSNETRLMLTAPQNVIGLKLENMGTCALVLVMANSLERRSCADSILLSTRLFPHSQTMFVGFPETSFDDLITSDGQKLYRVRGNEIVARSTVLGTRIGSFNYGTVNKSGQTITAYLGGEQGVSRVDLPFELLFRDGFDQR